MTWSAIGPRNPVSQRLHAAKYRQKGETFDDYCVRYARTTADDETHFRKLLTCLREQSILPAGRQQRAVGWAFQTTAFNCFVGGTIPDDTRGIGDALTEAMLTLRSGGGCGWDFGTLRPEGEPVRGLGDDAYASGPVSFMGMWHAMCNTIRSAGERRGAMMGVLPVWHPDILTFIRAKQNEKALTNFNISVGVTNEFMEAIEADKLFSLRFDGRAIRTVRALDLWASIMENNWDWAEPGVLFLDIINGMNPLYYCEDIRATNPCFTGDTKVWTAYGPKTFSELATTGNTVPVLTQLSDGRLVYRDMTKPRRTQRKASLVKVWLRGSGRKAGKLTSVRCTPEHVFYLKNGSKVKAKDLLPGNRVFSAYRGKANQKGYMVVRGTLHTSLEHHIAAEYQHGRWPDSNEDVHHINEVKADNRPENTEILPSSKHRSRHMQGDRNPMRRFPERNYFLTADFSGSNNGRYRNDVSDEQLQKLREEGKSYKEIARLTGCSKYAVMYRLGWRRPAVNNHTVVRVEYLEEQEDVYCGTVADTGRFFVWCGDNEGVLVSNCGEQPLPPNGACLLLSHNLTKYLVPSYSRPIKGDMVLNLNDDRLKVKRNGNGVIDGPCRAARYVIDLDRLTHDVELSVRACDNVFERTVYPLEAQRQEALNKRRMGVGVTGMANALEVCGLRYGCDEYLAWQGHILEAVRDTAYRTSIEMAKRKGSFPLFDADKWLASGFARTLPEDIRHDIKKYGLRNGLLLSIAPTGTISITADNVSSGIEPPPEIEADRIIQFNDGPCTVALNDWAYEVHGVRCLTAAEVHPTVHVKVLCEAQKYVDSSISKTINVRGAKTENPGEGEVNYQEFKGLYQQAYKGGAKGCTTFNMNGKRAGIITERQDANIQTEANAPQPQVDDEHCYLDPHTGARVCG